jgi:hypothetical protein
MLLDRSVDFEVALYELAVFDTTAVTALADGGRNLGPDDETYAELPGWGEIFRLQGGRGKTDRGQIGAAYRSYHGPRVAAYPVHIGQLVAAGRKLAQDMREDFTGNAVGKIGAVFCAASGAGHDSSSVLQEWERFIDIVRRKVLRFNRLRWSGGASDDGTI